MKRVKWILEEVWEGGRNMVYKYDSAYTAERDIAWAAHLSYTPRGTLASPMRVDLYPQEEKDNS